jgi:hypothetical protein
VCAIYAAVVTPDVLAGAVRLASASSTVLRSERRQPPHPVAARVSLTTVRQSAFGSLLHAAWASLAVTRWQWQMIKATLLDSK